MIRELRRKFIAIIMMSLILFLAILIGLINAFVVSNINTSLDTILQVIANNDGDVPRDVSPLDPREAELFREEVNQPIPFQSRVFSMKLNPSGELLSSNLSYTNRVTAEEIDLLSQRIPLLRRTQGNIGNYRFLKKKTDYGTLIVLIDSSREQDIQSLIFWVSVFLAGVGLLLMFIPVRLFSRYALQPIEDMIRKQKRFITDAGHELKTPIAIISANADVLTLTGGQNQWIDNIKVQSVRLNNLVQGLLTLSRVEESTFEHSRSHFSMSQKTEEMAQSFLPLADSQNKRLSFDIAPNIMYYGNITALQEIVSILLDNAVKYSNEDGRIHLSLEEKNGIIHLTVKNSVDHLPSEPYSKLFDRFYRTDESRSRETGGSGIGLSIAKATADANRWDLSVDAPTDHSLAFHLRMKMRKEPGKVAQAQ